MNSVKVKPPQETCEAPSKGYHICECYGHTQDLPEYKKLSVPRTLQGFYAKQENISCCPCIPKTKEKHLNVLYCSSNPGTRDRIKPSETYRAYAPGNHKVYKADEFPDISPNATRDNITGTRLIFPNARNYGGTAAQRGFPTIGGTKRKTKEEKRQERMYDRKEFLKAVLRDEIRDRIDAEEELDNLEHQLGLRGSRHAQMLAAASKETQKEGEEDDFDKKTLSEQYDEVMEELRYVTRQPVGSKLNIIRMHYLLEEQERLKHLRELEKKKNYGFTTTK